MKRQISTFIFLLLVVTCWSQSEKKGGYIYDWGQFDDTEYEGLGERLIHLDSTGLSNIKHAPPVGIHPRIYVGPGELSAIKERLTNTESGQAVAAQIHAYTTLLHLGNGAYNRSAEYAVDDDGDRYIGNTGKWDASNAYQFLLNQDSASFLALEVKRKHITASMMALEAFECMIFKNEDDEVTGLNYSERASMLARAMAFWAELIVDDPSVNPNSNNFNLFGGSHMALAYDFLYNQMSDSQRSLVRKGLAQITPSQPRYGGDLSCYWTASNWCGLNSFEINTNLAIEGEEGYKPELTKNWMRAYYNFITYGWYPSGAGLEGLGKNYQFITTMIAGAKRGYSLLSHPHVRAYTHEFLLGIMQPFGEGFTSYDVWGGSGYDAEKGMYKFNPSDAVGMKYIFPTSPQVDAIWKTYISNDYQTQGVGYKYQQVQPDDSYHNYLILAALFSSDYNKDTDPSIYNQDYIASDRGLVVMKSQADSQALSLQFHCRQDMGGHTHGDRNDITLSGLGRIWLRKTYGGSQFQPTHFHSTILIDSQGVTVSDLEGDKCRQPGQLMMIEQKPRMSKCAGDVTYAYNQEWHWSAQLQGNDHPWVNLPEWSPVQKTWNDFQFEEKDEDFYSIAFYDVPHWSRAQHYERMVERKVNDLEKVYRTAAMIKGNHDFIIITDDIKKDDQTHTYHWLAQMARDLEIERTEVQLEDQDYKCDIIFKENGPRRLLIRVLNNENFKENELPGRLDTFQYRDIFNGREYTSNPNWERHRLMIQSKSIEPKFKILLYPYYSDQELPRTDWNASRDSLVVTFDDETHRIVFPELENGRTDIVLKEMTTSDQQESLDIKHTIDIFPNPTTDVLNIYSAQFTMDDISIYNQTGQLIYTCSPSLKEVKIITENWPSGNYHYRIQTEEKELRGSFIKN